VKENENTALGYSTLLSMTLWEWVRFVLGAMSLAGVPLWGAISVRDQLANLRHNLELHRRERHERTTLESQERLADMETRMRLVERLCVGRPE